MTRSEQRQFHIGDVISVATGKLVAPRLIEAVYDVVDWMTGVSHYTHQLPRASRQVAPFLRAQHPWLADLDTSVVNTANWRAWLNEQVAIHGETVTLTKLKPGEYEGHEPLDELMRIRELR